MQVRMSAASALRMFEGLERRLVQHVIEAETLNLEDARAMLVQASSGTATEADLRREDHPYARRHGTARRDPSLINARSGRFRRAWRSRRPQRAGRGRVVSRVRNFDPKARYMFGTKLMLPRPIIARVARQLAPVRRLRLRRAYWYTLTHP